MVFYVEGIGFCIVLICDVFLFIKMVIGFMFRDLLLGFWEKMRLKSFDVVDFDWVLYLGGEVII